jgi:hypothetical protein
LRKSFVVKVAAAGLASVAAALLYKKSNRTPPKRQGLAGDVSASGNAVSARAQEVTSTGPVRARKKRSDAGIKRGPRTNKNGTSAPFGDRLVPELESTDTSVLALSPNADASVQSRHSPSELEAEAHPS